MGRLSITRTPTHITLSWPSVPEADYDLQYSGGFKDWTTYSSYPGTGDIISVTIPITLTHVGRVFRLSVHIPDNTEVIGKATAAWNGSYVQLEWEPIGQGGYDIFRDNQLIAHTTYTDHRDTQISSGASYSYKVVFRP